MLPSARVKDLISHFDTLSDTPAVQDVASAAEHTHTASDAPLSQTSCDSPSELHVEASAVPLQGPSNYASHEDCILYESFMHSLMLNSPAKAQLRTLSSEKRHCLISTHIQTVLLRDCYAKNLARRGAQPNHFVALLAAKAIGLKDLQKLNVCLQSEPPEWYSQFAELDGFRRFHEYTVHHFALPRRTANQWGQHLAIVSILKSIMTLQIKVAQSGSMLKIQSHDDCVDATNAAVQSLFMYRLQLAPDVAVEPVTLVLGSHSIPPLQNRHQAISFLAHLIESHPNGWTIVHLALSKNPHFGPSQLPLRLWLEEFEAVVSEKMKQWNGIRDLSKHIFEMLAGDTFIWEPICAAPDWSHLEPDLLKYMLACLRLIKTIVSHAPGHTSQDRNQVREILEAHRKKQIFEKLSLCPEQSVRDLLESIILAEQADQYPHVQMLTSPTIRTRMRFQNG